MNPGLTVAGLAVLAISASLLADYLRIEPAALSRVCVFLLAAGAWQFAFHRSFPTKRELAVFGLFSFSFSLCIVLGYHIVFSGDPLAQMDSNYISDYSPADFAAFLGMIPSIFMISCGLLRVLRFVMQKRVVKICAEASCYRFNVKATAAFAVAIFVLWLPYLVVYYPGLIFSDSLSSLNQIFGYEAWSNHHPVIYTAFIGLCLKVSHFFGFGNAAGCALYCLIQMAFIAGCLSYAASWIVSLLAPSRSIRIAIYVALLVLFGFSPHFSSYGIAIWKDPAFSVSLMILTLFLTDAVLGRGVRSVALRATAFTFFSLIVVFSRNNGVYIVALICVLLAVSWLFRTMRIKDGRSEDGKGNSESGFAVRLRACFSARDRLQILLAVASAVVVALCLVVTGPVYSALGIVGSSASESLGIPISQMARVASLDGNMSDSDKHYLDKVFPLEEYASEYRPCCVDNLKWNSDFDDDSLANGFPEHWVSMLLKNPLAYFEAWELQTFGFWTVNQPAAYDFDNISTGVPRNVIEGLSEELASFGIDPTVGIRDQEVRGFFSTDEQSIPIGVLLWVMIYLGCCMVATKKSRWLVTLVPLAALMLTLLIASPIWYWPRYAAAMEFSLPFFIAMLLVVASHKKRLDGLQ